MKTITFSNDQLDAVRDALHARISHLENLLAAPDMGKYTMRLNDMLDVARQALGAVQS